MNTVNFNYASGFKISFLKQSQGPILFLEWLQNNRDNFKYMFDFSIKTISCEDEILNDRFVISFKNISKELATDCYLYIKNNI